MQSSLMRLHNSKSVRYNIELLTWSHKMDLIAMSNEKGNKQSFNRKQNAHVILFQVKLLCNG